MERSIGLPANLNKAIAANVEDSECTIWEQECVSEFIGFITGEANDHCQSEKRKTITAKDILWAMNSFGFDDYIEPLSLYLYRYCEDAGGKRGSLKGEPLLLKRPMIDLASGCSITPYQLPPNFQMAHHHGYTTYPPPMGNNYMQGDASNGRPSQCAVSLVDSEVDSLAKKGK